MRHIATMLLITVGLAVGWLFSESAYRGLLYYKVPDRFIQSATGHPPVWFMEKPRWRFHEKYGYEYGSERIHGGSASDGLVRSCWSWPANARGNMGLIEGRYEEAELKILVFGDSFTAQIDTGADPRGIAWPNYLQRQLSERLAKSVHVVNFGRDGTGILHMFDIAADKIAEWQPDLAIFAFITDDLTRARFWRTYTVVNGRERVLTTTVAQENPPMDKSADTAVVNSKATPAWCKTAVKQARRDDPVLAEMEAIVLEARARSQNRLSVFSLSRSYLLDRILHGSAFHAAHTLVHPSQNPRHAMTSFSQDPRFLANLANIRKTDVPIMLVHLATYDELAEDKEYIFRGNEESLLQSLAEITGEQIALTRENVEIPRSGLEKIKRSPDDAHPSVEGMKFYAQVVANALIRKTLAPVNQ